MPQAYEAVIGLEIHCQLATKSKLFCACSTRFGAPPNTQVCPVCLGHPGALPVANSRAIDLAIAMTLAAAGGVRQRSEFARKSYFYPDLPKGYQISQYDAPICEGGKVEFDLEGRGHAVALERIHVEEDAGKSIHGADAGADGDTLIDLNRCGVPLVEIVTRPILRSAGEVRAFLVELRRLVRWIGVGDANMEEGSLRCDANVSVRPRGSDTLGTKVELKNMNSIRFVGKAIDFEIERQIAEITGGGRVVQQTRLFDERAGRTRPMRSKEEAHDYRYFPDPDLPPIVLAPGRIEQIRAALPELPRDRAKRMAAAWSLSADEVAVLASTRDLADYFEAIAARGEAIARRAAAWVPNELLAALRSRGGTIEAFPVGPGAAAELLALVEEGAISGKIAKRVFAEMIESADSARAVVERLALGRISDSAALAPIVDRVIADNPDVVASLEAGKKKSLGFLVGQIMKSTRGQADPALVHKLLEERLL